MFPLLLSVYADGGKGLFFINMKLIDSKVEYLPQGEGLNGIYKQIEIAGRVAYQSLDKITDDSAKVFVDRMINSKHYAALEHGTVYLDREVDYNNRDYLDFEEFFSKNPYSKINYEAGICYVTTNFRVLEERFNLKEFWEKYNILYMCSPTEDHDKRYTFRFTTDIGVCRELLRHRVFSFLNESTRYCNYSKGKYGEELTFIEPSWGMDALMRDTFLSNLSDAESHYLALIDQGWKAEQARQVLPLATKTELIMTGFSSDWRYLLDLRLFNKTGKAHPDMLNLMEKLRYEALEAGIWYDIMKYPSKFE